MKRLLQVFDKTVPLSSCKRSLLTQQQLVRISLGKFVAPLSFQQNFVLYLSLSLKRHRCKNGLQIKDLCLKYKSVRFRCCLLIKKNVVGNWQNCGLPFFLTNTGNPSYFGRKLPSHEINSSLITWSLYNRTWEAQVGWNFSRRNGDVEGVSEIVTLALVSFAAFRGRVAWHPEKRLQKRDCVRL